MSNTLNGEIPEGEIQLIIDPTVSDEKCRVVMTDVDIDTTVGETVRFFATGWMSMAHELKQLREAHLQLQQRADGYRLALSQPQSGEGKGKWRLLKPTDFETATDFYHACWLHAAKELDETMEDNERLKEALFTAQLEISKGTSEIALLNGELSSLKEQGDGWISVDVPPEVNKWYQVATEYNVLLRACQYDGEGFVPFGEQYIDKRVKYYRSIPQPPKS